jgi:hypothetical protein
VLGVTFTKNLVIRGAPNHLTTDLKEMILQAGTQAHPDGLVAYLKKVAIEHPPAFLTILGKIIPTQVQAEVAATQEIVVRGGLPKMPTEDDFSGNGLESDTLQ